MKKEYKTPLTEIVYLHTNGAFQEDDEPTQDSTGTVKPGPDGPALGNDGFFDEADGYGSSKSLWD